MNIQLQSSVFSLSFVVLFLVIFVAGEITNHEEIDSTGITTEKLKFDGSLKNIISKVESIQAGIHKTLNESKMFDEHIAQTRSESLVRRGYQFTKGIGYHKLFLTKLTWHDALHFCRTEMAHLAVIDSSAEASVLGNIVKEKLASEMEIDEENVAYVGIHDYCKNGSWITIFFDVLDNAEYLHWKEGLSSNNRISSVPNCAVIDEDGKLSNVRCSSKQAFICEAKL